MARARQRMPLMEGTAKLVLGRGSDRLQRCAIAGAAIVACAVGGCGDGSAEPRKNARPTFTITTAGFEPKRLRVEVGDRVAFVNRDPDGMHAAEYDPTGTIDSSPGEGPTDHTGGDVNYAYKRGFATHWLFPGERQVIVFRVARRYKFHCPFHPEMRAVIEVVDRREGSG